MALKFENIATIFPSFNPYPSLPPVATEDGKQFQCPNIVLNNKTGPRDGAVVRALASHQCGPGSNPGVDAICGLSLLLVLSLAPRGFPPGTPVFASPQKPAFPNSNSTRNQLDEEPLCGCATSKSLFIYLFIYLFNSIDAKTVSSF